MTRPRTRPWPLRAVIFALKVGVALALLGVTAFWGLTLYLDARLPDVLSVADYRRAAPQMSRVYAANGEEIGVFRTERRTLVRLADLPAHVPAALVASEDASFYEHDGLDYLGMVRAMWINVQTGRFTQGASTITQQLARSFYLTADKTLERKLLEVFLARKLDRSLDKSELLELYLNQVYFGEGRYGIEEAARHYFGKGAASLNLAEAATLIGILPAPDRLNPFDDRAAADDRRARVLEAMAARGDVSAAAARAALPSPRLAERRVADVDRYPWFTDLVRRRLEPIVGRERLYKGGLRIHTSLEPRVQDALDAAFAGVEPATAQVAGVVLEPASREIKALVGGRDFARSQFNRAVMARRQAGSTFKPFVYAAGIESGAITAETTWANTRIGYRGRGGVWRPRNADGRHDGAQVGVEEALVRSLNVVAVQALADVGVVPLTDFARRAGLRAPIPPDLTAALGSFEVTPLELANAFATFASGGIAADPVVVRRAEAPDGRVVFAEDARPRRAIAPELAERVTTWLVAAVARGTGRRARVAGAEVAGKTGTTDDARDVWFAGYTRRLVGAIWVGHDDGAPLGDHTGGDTAAPVFGALVERLEGTSRASLAPP